MTRGFLAVSAALLVAAIMLSPAMAYTISSSGKSPYTIGSGSPYQYTMGSAALQSFSIGSGSPYQYTIGSGALQPYSIGMGTPASRIGPSDVKAPAVPEVVEPEVVEPEVAEPEVVEPEVVEPEVVEPEVVEPEVAEPEVVEPEVAEPEVAEPEVAEPEVAEPEVAEPEVAEPEVVEPEVAEPPVEVPALMNIVETAVADGNFNTLVAAVEAAGLSEVLSSDGPFTVFAPTDEAFASLVDIDLEDVEALVRILTYHVAAGEYMAEDVAMMATITTLEGSDLIVEVTDEGVRVNGALVILADVVCSNGVIHVIDAVLIPAEEPEMPAETEVVTPEEIMPPEGTVEETVDEVTPPETT